MTGGAHGDFEPGSAAARLVAGARTGDLTTLATLLDAQPELLHLRVPPYEWTLLHVAAAAGQDEAVGHLLARGLDVNVRERGDNTCPLHWAAAHGHVTVVKRLIDAGADVVGEGDDHTQGVIGWAAAYGEGEPRRAIVDLLLQRGARHHIFSAIAMNDADEVQRLVAADPMVLNARQSRNEDNQQPLHTAVRLDRSSLVALLIQLGADPLGTDASGYTAAAYATTPSVDRPVMERIRALTAGELISAQRGHRTPRGAAIDLVAALALADFDVAATLAAGNRKLLEPSAGVLHVMAKRGDVAAVQWLLAHGADASARSAHWDSDVTALHLAILGDHPAVVRALLDAGADPNIRDTKHDSDAMGWAVFFGRIEIQQMIQRSSD